jgi:hypothetical protein
VLVQANLPDCAVLRSQPARRAKLRRDRAKLERIEQELQDFQNAARCPPG